MFWDMPYSEVISPLPWNGKSITMAFTGLRPVDARKTENPPAATPVQRLVIWLSSFALLQWSL
jgi:hypothetical protein